MNLKLPQLLALVIGAVLIYSAVRNVSALDVLKAAATGAPMPVPDSMPTKSTATVGPDGKPDGGKITPDGKYIPPTDKTQPQPQGDSKGNVQAGYNYNAPYTVVSV